MRIGFELLTLARDADAGSVFVVGIGREVGKTTTLRAMYEAACNARLRSGLASLNPRHRLWLQPETIFVTARGALARTPATEIMSLSRLPSPAGTLLYARAMSASPYELVGPSTASGVREVVERLACLADLAIVDGAVDRAAAVAGSHSAIVIACGAAAATTMEEAAGEAGALAAKLSVPQADPNAPAVHIDGALTTTQTASLIAAAETRQIVVRDPTQIAMSGRSLTGALARLNIRCLRPLRVIAATAAAIGPDRSFEPRAFARAVAESTGLPTFDVYAGTRAA